MMERWRVTIENDETGETFKGVVIGPVSSTHITSLLTSCSIQPDTKLRPTDPAPDAPFSTLRSWHFEGTSNGQSYNYSIWIAPAWKQESSPLAVKLYLPDVKALRDRDRRWPSAGIIINGLDLSPYLSGKDSIVVSAAPSEISDVTVRFRPDELEFIRDGK